VTAAGALSGLKVLDLTHIASGPFATMMLADMGADVIKVEKVGVGDGARQMDIAIHGSMSGYFLGLNKNKRSIALDLSSTDGHDSVLALARQADVVIENFRPGAADRLGLGYEDVQAVNQSIVYCSITGFGEQGPLRDEVAYDVVGQAISGIMSITGETDRSPAKCGAPISDLTAGLFAALGILAALHHRERTGQGQHVRTSLLGASAALLSSYVTSQAMGTPFDRVGSAHNTLAPYQAFEGSDGRHFIVAAANDKFFGATVTCVGLPELNEDARFSSNAARTEHRAELAQLLQERFISQPSEHWLRTLRDCGVPVSPIHSIAEMAALDQMAINHYVEHIDQPGIGKLPVVVTPLTFSATPVEVRTPPPALNEHHDAILAIANGAVPW
jgi:crotonobetainyl-CoA:carnitine CoA-transferase CaiB-like acyl-CoA transferase